MLRKPALGFKEESHKEIHQRFTANADAHMLAPKDTSFLLLDLGERNFSLEKKPLLLV